MATRRALLLIADIGGYTEYMQFHRSILGHAEAATSRMLERVVDAAPGFELVEIEGDAAFLSRDADALDGGAALKAVGNAVVAMHQAFHAERQLVQLNMCPCGSCKQTSDLKLKFVAHVGEVATQTIRGRDKLVGMDVIYVHRLLKNPVEVPEYVLVSEDLLATDGAAPPEPQLREIAHDLEGIGPVRLHYAEVRDFPDAPPPAPKPSLRRRFGGTLGMVGRGLPHMGRQRHPTALAG